MVWSYRQTLVASGIICFGMSCSVPVRFSIACSLLTPGLLDLMTTYTHEVSIFRRPVAVVSTLSSVPNSYLAPCQQAQSLFSRLRTGEPFYLTLTIIHTRIHLYRSPRYWFSLPVKALAVHTKAIPWQVPTLTEHNRHFHPKYLPATISVPILVLSPQYYTLNLPPD